jgi:hypothetical protein
MATSATLAAPPLDGLAAEILARGSIRAEDVLQLRRAIYRDGAIRRPEAEVLLRMHRRSRRADPSWDAFYVEALSDFFFWGRGDDAALGEDDSALLATWLGEDGRVEDPVELRLLLNLVLRSAGAPPGLRRLAMDSVLHSVLTCSKSIYGKGVRRPGAIDEDDVELVRRLVYGQAGAGGITVTRDEAEFLFALNNRSAARDNTPAWTPLFVKAITMYLLHAGESPDRVDDEEARWLIAHVEADRKDCDNERELLRYLRQEAAWLSPLLQSICSRMGV